MEEKEPKKSPEREQNPEREGVFPCPQCGSATHQDLVKAALWKSTGLIAIEGIPARVCEVCGEQSYDEQTTQRIENIVADQEVRAKQEMLVPIFSLAEVEVPKRASRPEVLDQGEMEAVQSMFTGMEQGRQRMSRNQESPEAYPCNYCESNTCEETVKSAFWADKGLIAIEDIRARVCQRCGEQFYDDETMRKIAKLTETGFPAENAKRKISVPLFSLAEAQDRTGEALP